LEVTIEKDEDAPTDIWLHDNTGSTPVQYWSVGTDNVYWEGGTSKTYWVNTTEAVKYTPYAEDTGSGVQGFNISSTSTSNLTLDLEPDDTYDLYAFDNLDTYDSVTGFTIESDVTDPDVSDMTLGTLPDFWYLHETTLYYNQEEASEFDLAVTDAKDTGGSGIKGYSRSSDGFATAGTTVTISKSTIAATIYAFDNVGNSENVTYTREPDSNAPNVNNFTFVDLPAGFYYDAEDKELYYKDSPTFPVDLTPDGATDTDESGIKGYTLSDDFSTASMSDLSVPDETFSVHVFDNVEHKTTITDISVTEDAAAPELSFQNTTGWFGTEIYGVTINDAGSGLDTIEILHSANDTFDSNDSELTWNAGESKVTDLEGLTNTGDTDYIRFTITDKLDNEFQQIYERERLSDGQYTLTEYTPTNPSISYRPRTKGPVDARVPAHAGLGNVSYADPFAIEAGYTRQVPAATPVSRTRTNGTPVAAPAVGRTGSTAGNRTVDGETVNEESADDMVAVPQNASSIQAAALARSGMSPLQRRSSMHTETVTTETRDTDTRIQQDSETQQNRTVSGDAEPASAPDGGAPEPNDNTPRRNTGMPYCMPGTDSRRDEEEEEFEEG